MARYVGRENVRKRLAALEEGRVVYEDGSARIETEDETLTVRPPFGLAYTGKCDSLEFGPLFEALDADHVVAVLLVRLGGYAAGVFDGERLVASKVGSRFVKGRHKKGGSSANRFRRRREEQARALIDKAAETFMRVVEPHDVEFVALGGDRRAVDQVLTRIELPAPVMRRFFTTRDPRQRELERLPYELYAAELS